MHLHVVVALKAVPAQQSTIGMLEACALVDAGLGQVLGNVAHFPALQRGFRSTRHRPNQNPRKSTSSMSYLFVQTGNGVFAPFCFLSTSKGRKVPAVARYPCPTLPSPPLHSASSTSVAPPPKGSATGSSSSDRGCDCGGASSLKPRTAPAPGPPLGLPVHAHLPRP